jgi:hypothetical protein
MAPSVAYAQSPMLSQDGCSYLFYRTPVYLVAILHDLRHEVFFYMVLRHDGFESKTSFRKCFGKRPTYFFFHLYLFLSSFAEPTFLDKFCYLKNVV